MSDEFKRLAAGTIGYLDKLMAGLRDGNPNSAAEARRLILELVDRSTPRKLAYLLTGVEAAACMMAEHGQPKDWPAENPRDKALQEAEEVIRGLIALSRTLVAAQLDGMQRAMTADEFAKFTERRALVYADYTRGKDWLTRNCP